MMIRLIWTLMLAAPVLAQEAPKEVKGFVVSMDDTKLVVSNIRVGGAGQTFTMTAPKDGSQPTWVAADPPAGGGEKPKMVMMTAGDGSSPLTLTELVFAKDAFKPADFPAGTEIVATYREAGSKKTLQTLHVAKKP